MSFLIKKNYTNLFLSYLNLTFQKRSCKTKMLVWRVVWWQQYRIWPSQMCRKSVPITGNYRRDRKIFWKRRKLSFRLVNLLFAQFLKLSFIGRMLKAPPLISCDLHFSVLYCNSGTYDDNIGQNFQKPSFAIFVASYNCLYLFITLFNDPNTRIKILLCQASFSFFIYRRFSGRYRISLP